MRPIGSAKDLELRRRRAAALLDTGMTPTQVALAIGVTRQTVTKWKALIRDEGKRALKSVASARQYLPT